MPTSTFFQAILDPMILFLSWSGERSKLLAEAFDKWIQSVIQAVKPFFSPDDVEKGSFWAMELNEILQDARTGILFVTPENKERPWLLYEAGALAAKMGKPKLIPLLFDLQPSDLVGPLTHLNAAVFSKEDVRKAVSAINNQLLEGKLDPQVLDSVFEKWWPDLESGVSEVLQSVAQPTTVSRPSDDILEELLAISRSTQQQLFVLERQLLRPAPRSVSVRRTLSKYADDLVRRCLEDLPKEFRDAVILADIEGIPVDEAAAIVGCEPKEFYGVLHAGRMALLDKLRSHSET